MFEEGFLPFNPVNFFQFSSECQWIDLNGWQKRILKDKTYLLPSTSLFSDEEEFARVYMGWNQGGLVWAVSVSDSFHQSFFPDVSRGDSVEVFIDTRDVKTSGFNTRFCHHFFALPTEVDGVRAGEITRFRTEDAHELCNASELKVEVDHGSKHCLVKLFIPTSCLNGYDPDQFDRIGFTYRINRLGKSAQHFSVLSDEFNIEQQPSLWSSFKLLKK